MRKPLSPDRIFALAMAAVALLIAASAARDGHTTDKGAAPAYPVDYSSVVEAVMPSLVRIENLSLAGHPAIAGIGQKAEVAQVSEGTGFFIDRSGLILTNYHVVDGAESLHVVTTSRKGYDAELVGADVLTDLALIRIKPDFKVIPAVLGDSSKLKVGQGVLALGNPLGLEFQATAGIVSGFGPPGPDYIGFYDFIQVDVNIKPGNSGGPLLNSRGEVVGINNSYMGPGSGIGFAIPINRAREVVSALGKDGRISRGFLGVVGQPLTAGLAERLKLPDISGALISSVMQGGPGDTGGLKEGDVVLRFNGAPVLDDRSLQEKVFMSHANTGATLLVAREGHRLEVPVTLGELKAHSLISQRVIRQCGLTLEELNRETATKLGIGELGGLFVLKVVPGCPAYEGGLRFGDVIKKVEGAQVNTVPEFYRAYNETRRGSQVLLSVMRGSRPLYITIRQGEGQ